MASFLSQLQGVVRRIDWWYIGAALLLAGIGLVMQYSISVNQQVTDGGQFDKQLIFFGIGITVFVLATAFDHRSIRLPSGAWYVISVVTLIAVLLFGREIQGTTGWFVIAGFSIQPVEFVKVLFILFMASSFEHRSAGMQSPQVTFFSGALAAVLVGLILLQPDLGSAAILFVLWFGYATILRSPKWVLGLVVVAVVIASIIGWFYLFEDYQKNRLSTFLDPSADPLGTGYNITQSIVAVGSGSLWGKGLGQGSQSQLQFLPEVSSDFIFAAYAEEFGFSGVLLLFGALLLLLYRLWRFARISSDPYVIILSIGAFLYLAFQSTLVIGMNIGVLPVTGLPLPLVSAGGSSMIATFLLLGLIHHYMVRSGA